MTGKDRGPAGGRLSTIQGMGRVGRHMKQLRRQAGRLDGKLNAEGKEPLSHLGEPGANVDRAILPDGQ